LRFEAGHRSDLNPATLAAFPRVSNCGICHLLVLKEIAMPAQRKLTMRRLRQLLRLHHEGVSAREIVRMLGAARSTIQDALNRAKSAGLSWPLSSDLTDEVLEKRLFSPAGRKAVIRRRGSAAKARRT
jgi:hypothetical protein